MEEAIGVKVEFQKYPTDSDFWNNLPAQIAAKTAPDFIALNNELYLPYINDGLVVPLIQYVEDGTITCWDNLDQNVKDVWTIDGEIYVLKKLRKLPARDALRVASVGLLLAVHWLFFYGSIKASNVSIGVVCLSLMSFFTALFDPVINRHRISASEILFSLVGVAGIVLIFHFDTRYRAGILMGVVSSALASLFTICNKKVASGYPSGTTLLYEMGGGFAGLTCMLPVYLYFFPVPTILPSATDFGYLLLFASVCTVLLYILQIQVLKKISAFTFNLTYNLEPIYSIILAMIIFP